MTPSVENIDDDDVSSNGIKVLGSPDYPQRRDLLYQVIADLEPIARLLCANSAMAESAIHGKKHWAQTAILADWLFRHTKNRSLYFLVFTAAYLHDVGRVNEHIDRYHGIRGIFGAFRSMLEFEDRQVFSPMTSYAREVDGANQMAILTQPTAYCPHIMDSRGYPKSVFDIPPGDNRYYPFMYADWSIGIISEVISHHNIQPPPDHIPPSGLPDWGDMVTHAFILVRMADILGRFRLPETEWPDFSGEMWKNSLYYALEISGKMIRQAREFIVDGKELD